MPSIAALLVAWVATAAVEGPLDGPSIATPPANVAYGTPAPSAALQRSPTTAAAATPPPGREPSLTIGIPLAESQRAKPAGGLMALLSVGSSLAIVLGLFLLLAWGMRKAAPRGSIILPSEVFEVLGRAPLGARQQVQLLRCGSKLLLVSVTPGGAETLTEVTEPTEVDRLAGLCHQAHPHSATAAFRQIFEQFATRSGASQPVAAERETPDVRPIARRDRRWEDSNA